MPNGGVLQIEICIKDAENVAVSFIDQGIGIPEEFLLRLGEPFFTTKKEGNGLGLLICYKIIENHNGNIHITSEINKGTNIDIMLPLPETNQKKKLLHF